MQRLKKTTMIGINIHEWMYFARDIRKLMISIEVFRRNRK